MSQVKISGNASGTGVLTIAAPNTNTDRSITIPDKAGAIAVGAGTIVQVVQTVYGTRVQVTSTSDTSIGLSASITPTSSSNKILIFISIPFQTDGIASFHAMDLFIYKNGSSHYQMVDDNWFSNTETNKDVFTFHYLSSPATTSSTSYEIYAHHDFSGRTAYFNDPSNNGLVGSIMTLMEVVA